MDALYICPVCGGEGNEAAVGDTANTSKPPLAERGVVAGKERKGVEGYEPEND